VRGDGYVWFDMAAAPIEAEPIESIVVHPLSCSTKDLTQLVIEHLKEYRTSFIEKNKASISKEDNVDDIFKKLKEMEGLCARLHKRSWGELM